VTGIWVVRRPPECPPSRPPFFDRCPSFAKRGFNAPIVEYSSRGIVKLSLANLRLRGFPG
jgi:hypothetical protein